jgi:phosphatidate cytidylyltransferase
VTESIRKYNNLTQRIITGIFGAAVIITAVSLGPWTYFAVFFLICFFTLLEFYKLAGLDGLIPQKTLGMFAGMGIFTLSFLIEMDVLHYRYYFLIYPLIFLVFIIKLYKKTERKPFTNIAFTLLGIVYISVPFALLNVAAFEVGVYNFEIIFGSLFIFSEKENYSSVSHLKRHGKDFLEGRSLL